MTILKFITKLMIRTFLIGLFLFAAVLITSYLLGPPDISSNPITSFYDDTGELIGDKTKLEQEVVLKDIASHAIDATIVIEDKHFYDHHGFDIFGIARAIRKNIQALELKEGASTITQQYARNLYLSHEKTWIRKVKEAFYTIRLEMFYSKDEILTGYLNTIYYGHGAYGIEEASSLFFNKKAKDLTIAEASMLAGIPKGPTYYSPFNDDEKAFKRQDFILKQLLQHHYITQAEYYSAKSEPLKFDEPYKKTEVFAHFFRDSALREAAIILDENQSNILTSGYKIYTTLDRELQTKTEDYIGDAIPNDSDIEIGVITIDPKSGAIKNLVGGKDYEKSSFNRAIDAERMVGSAFKPILYYAALEHGYTPSTMLLSEPTSFVMADGGVYKPSNFNDYYAYKPITLSKALALSDNIYAVKTNLFLSPDQVVETAKRFGISSTLPSVPSLALGSASITLKEMSEAYGLIANGGHELHSFTITKIINQHGDEIYSKSEKQREQILDEKKIFILSHLMTGMFDRRLNGYMEVTGTSIIDKLTHLYAGKSGTTDTDSWMIGFSPKAVTGVWTGYDKNLPIQKVDEKVISKEVWANTIEAAHKGKEEPEFTVPDGIVKKLIDPDTGQLATKECPIVRTTYFERGTEPTDSCHLHSEDSVKDKQKTQTKSLWKKLLDIFR